MAAKQGRHKNQLAPVWIRKRESPKAIACQLDKDRMRKVKRHAHLLKVLQIIAFQKGRSQAGIDQIDRHKRKEKEKVLIDSFILKNDHTF